MPWGAARISKPLQNAWKVFHSELILSEVIPTSTPANELLRQVVEGVLGAHRLNRKKRLSQEERADAQRATARLWELIGTVTGTFIDDK